MGARLSNKVPDFVDSSCGRQIGPLFGRAGIRLDAPGNGLRGRQKPDHLAAFTQSLTVICAQHGSTAQGDNRPLRAGLFPSQLPYQLSFEFTKSGFSRLSKNSGDCFSSTSFDFDIRVDPIIFHLLGDQPGHRRFSRTPVANEKHVHGV